MKRIPEKLQRLSQRAAELRQTLQNVPPKIVAVRESVAAATAEVQKLRADVLSSVATLRAETDEQLLGTLREIDGGVEVLAEAGCRLDRVEMDLGPARRLLVHLSRTSEVAPETVRALVVAEKQPAVRALLTAIEKADELAARVELVHMRPAKLVVVIGLIPSVRVGWENAEHETATDTAIFGAPEAAGQESIAEDDRPSETERVAEATHSFFPPRAAPGVQHTEAGSKPAAAPGIPSAVTHVAPAPAPVAFAGSRLDPTANWRSGALDRFKKMPDLGRTKG